MRLRNVDPRPYVPFTYVFKGLPGTGKTTTARKLGQIFYDMGLLSAPDVIEVSASQLIGEYCGQTGPKTKRLLESALGKVLFIDEAYRLAGHAGSFAEEAVSELVDAVTKPQFARKLIIVLAGYEEDMDRLLRSNQGMRSRFATEFTFRPLRAEQCVEQLRAVVERVGITIQSTREMDTMTRTSLMTLLNRLSNEKGWASGRSVETLGERLIGHIFKECAMKGYTGKDLSVTGKELVTILGQASGHGGAGAKKWGGQGPMGARQVMTLRDLEGYE
jgi:SpoVK/Ycf46/Vps4 family AAA+-type ATPase